MNEDVIALIEDSRVLHLLAKAGQNDSRYWRDFLELITDFRKNLDEKEFKNFLIKSQLNQVITLAQYLQFASETTVVDYVMRKYKGFRSEPQYGKKKNPECSFEYEGRTVNVEVKCPDYSKRKLEEQVEAIKVFAAERFPQKEMLDESIQVIEQNIDGNIMIISRMDNKLKDYLISAHDKFPSSGRNYFNILVICLDIISDMDEWYSYVFGNEGVFSEQSYVKENYENVDAIMLTNIVHGHTGDPECDKYNCWNLENYVSLLFLNPMKEKDKDLADYYFKHAITLFGNNSMDFLRYQCELDLKNNEREKWLVSQGIMGDKLTQIQKMYYSEDKIIGLKIISEWCKSISH